MQAGGYSLRPADTEETFTSGRPHNNDGNWTTASKRDEVPDLDADGVKDGGERDLRADHLWTMTMMAY